MIYDLLIIGGGPAGYRAALKAAHNNLSVCICEEKEIGGTCLNRGCIPLKGLLHQAVIKEKLTDLNKSIGLDYSFSFENQKLQKNNENVINGFTKNILSLFNHYNINFITEKCKIISNCNGIIQAKTENCEIQSKNLLIATGANPRRIEYCSEKIKYSDEVLFDSKTPNNIIIIGGGAIGLEFADYYNSIGCNVTVLENTDKIGGNIDYDVSGVLEKRLLDKGISIEKNVKIIHIDDNTIELEDERVFKSFDFVLVAIGRVPNSENIGLENIGVLTSDKGEIIVNTNFQTSNSNVYACGDVVGKKMLAHTAYKEAENIVNFIVNGKIEKIDYNLIPSVIYTSPEVASIGYTEKICQEMGIAYKVVNLPLAYSSKYFLENGKKLTIAKLLANEKKEIIGCQLVGNGISELITLAEIFINKKMTANEIVNFVFPHPSYSEILYDLAEQLDLSFN